MLSHAPRLVSVALFLALQLAACSEVDPLEQARGLQAVGRFADSIEPLRTLLEERPDDPEVLYLYGVALAASDEPTRALWAFEKAMLDPDWIVPAGLQRASSALSLRSHDAAIVAATRVLEAEPDNVAALTLRARARVESRRDYEGGLEDAEKVLAQEPDSLDALVSRTAALLALERVEEAEEAIGQLETRFREAELGPELTSRYCFARVEFAKERGDLELAEERLEKCVEELPSAKVGVSEAIDFYDALGRPERSIEVLRQALEESPESIDYRSGLAMRLSQAGEKEEAEALLREAAESDVPAQAMLGWAALGEYYLSEQRHGDAADALAKALEIGEDPQLLFLYSEALISAGRFDEALPVAERMPIPAYAALIRGRVAQQQGRPAEALEHFSEGLVLWPNNAVARYYAARAAEDVGDFDRAIEEYRYALRADPGAADTRWRLTKLLLAGRQYEPALNAVLHAWSRSPGGPELEILAIRVAATAGGRPGFIRTRLESLSASPVLWAQGVAAAADGLAGRRGVEFALEFVREQSVDLRRPVNAPVLTVLIGHMIDSDRAAPALEATEVALAARPGFATYHALRGDALAALGRVDEARGEYERALELDEGAAPALAGLARLARTQGEDEQAIALFERAAEADAADVDSRVEAAALLVAANRSDRARVLLEQGLEHEPYDPAVVIPLAQIALAEDPDSPQGRALAQRAVHCGGGDEARALLGRGVAGGSDRLADVPGSPEAQ